mgnify:CR=1 FL=1
MNWSLGSQYPLKPHRSEILNAKRHPGYVSHVGYSKPEYSCYACRMLAEMRGLLVGCEHDKRAIDGKLAARLTNTCLACNTAQIEVVDGWRDQGLNEPQCCAVGAGHSGRSERAIHSTTSALPWQWRSICPPLPSQLSACSTEPTPSHSVRRRRPRRA